MVHLPEARKQFRAASAAGSLLGSFFKRKARPAMPQGFSGSAAQFEQLLQRGLLVWGAVVQANVLLRTRGQGDAPANLVWSEDQEFDLRPEELAAIARAVANLDGTIPPEPELAKLAQELGVKNSRKAGLVVPLTLTGGRRVLLTTVLINRSCLPGRVLSGPFLPLLVDPADGHNCCVAPAAFWPAPLVETWREAAAKAPRATDVPAANAMTQARQQTLAEAQAAAAEGKYIQISPAAVAELRRLMAELATPCAVQIRCVPTSEDDSYIPALDLVEADAATEFACVIDGFRVHIPDGQSVLFLRGAVIHFLNTPASRGFRIDVP